MTTRQHKLGQVLRHLHLAGPLSRAELTTLMDLNRSTIAGLVGELVALGVVDEQQPAGAQGSAGRPSLLVRPRPDRVQVLAVEVGVHRVSVALVGVGGRVMARRHRQVSTGSPSEVTRLIALLTEALLADDAAAWVIGVGVSIAGAVRQDDGQVRFAPNLGWVDIPFGRMLGARLGQSPIRVGNDADLGALAEHLRGAARGVSDVVFVTGDSGVGGGLILAGRPVRGAGGYAGELGHICLDAHGRQCRCGAIGCWETEIGAEAVARALGLPEADARQVRAALQRLDPRDAGKLAGVARYLGLGLASLVNLINPQRVILGGLPREIYRVSGPVVDRQLASTALSAPAEQVQVRAAELGDDVVLIGAAELAWAPMLADPAAVLGAAGDGLGTAGGGLVLGA